MKNNAETEIRFATLQPTVPGVNTAVRADIQSADTNEVMAGLAHEIGGKGAGRLDFVYRKYGGFYGNFPSICRPGS